LAPTDRDRHHPCSLPANRNGGTPLECRRALHVDRIGAGDGNRTHASSLGSCSSTIELHPRSATSLCRAPSAAQRMPGRHASPAAGRLAQNLLPTLRKKLASLPPFWPTVRLLPVVTSRPNSSLRMP